MDRVASMPPSDFIIRPYVPEDREAVYEVCLKTGDAGMDASLLLTDPKALGHIYVGPYMELEPDLAHVLTDTGGVCGYVLGTRESARFYRRYQEEWLPRLRREYPRPTTPPEHRSITERIIHQYYEPEIYFPAAFARFPAHLHIDLLPRAQGQGQGVRMIETFLARLTALHIPGVHLVVAESNARARHFYEKLGFKMIDQVRENVYMARHL